MLDAPAPNPPNPPAAGCAVAPNAEPEDACPKAGAAEAPKPPKPPAEGAPEPKAGADCAAAPNPVAAGCPVFVNTMHGAVRAGVCPDGGAPLQGNYRRG